MMKEIFIGAAPVRAARIGYVGERGFELHVPTEFAGHVYDTLWAAGQEHGIANVGYRAIESLRMEKGYVYWSGDITPDYTPIEAGLGFRVHLKSKDDFIGRNVLEKQKAEGTDQQLCTFVTSENLPLTGGETILLGDKVVSLATSVAFGCAVQKTIIRGYLDKEFVGSTEFSLDVFGELPKISQVKGPVYDPQNLALKG